MDAHLRDLRYFVAVAEELNFTRAAADRLFISQPALSKQIRQLEASLRVSLFERDHRSVALTKAGEAMLPQAKRVLAQWDETQRAVAEAAATVASTLTVGFQTRIGRGLIPNVTARMARQLPGWSLSFRQVPWRDPSVGLGGTDVDVAIAWLPLPDNGLRWCVTSTEPRWVALRAGHRLAGRSSVSLADLADEPFIALPTSSEAARRFWLAADERAGAPKVAMAAETAEEIFEAVAAGVGVTLLAEGNVDVYRRDDIVCVPVEGITPAELAVVWRAGEDREAVQVFVEACFQCLCPEGLQQAE